MPFRNRRPSAGNVPRTILGLLCAFIAIACERPSPTSPRAFSKDPSPELLGANTRFPPAADFIPAVVLAQVPPDAAVNLSDSALEDAIEGTGGIAIIGLKSPRAQRTSVTRTIPSMGRVEIMDARNAVGAAGVEVTRSYVNMAAVVARVPRGRVAALRALPFVNYIEPNFNYHPAQVQDTSWGVKKIHAPVVWASGYIGYGANITILDSGIDYQHLVAGGDGPARLNLTDCLYTPEPSEGIDACWDEYYHGSHVAGIIAMESNSEGLIGAAYFPSAVASIRVCGEPGLGEYPGLPDCHVENIVGGLDWTVSNGRPRQIVNMSLGGYDYSLFFAEGVAKVSQCRQPSCGRCWKRRRRPCYRSLNQLPC
jgi:subtilisin family serine protease